MIRSIFKRKGLSCDDVMEVLQSYLDGETDAATARGVAAHLDDCVDCDRESTVFKNIKVSLASNAAPVDPDIMASIRAFSDRITSGEIE